MNGNMGYEEILDRMLAQVPPDMDKRQSSVIYASLAGAAVEMYSMYSEMEVVLDEMFADTAGREYLIRRAAERGLKPKAASYAVLKGEFNMDIPLGSRFSLETLNYKVIEKMNAGVFKLECETIGEVGNTLFGTLIPIGYIKGLTKAELTELLIPGEDEEETEHFRSRYFASLDSQAFGGNIADYREKVTAVSGVGGVKVYPAWNGGGTVKLVIINSEYEAPSAELVEMVKNTIDPGTNEGKGYGLAPIGHLVTVEGAREVSVSIGASITYQVDYNFERCRESIFKEVDRYLHELNMGWQENSQTVVRVSRIESRLLDVEGILDVSDTRINGVSGNFEMPSDAIGIRGDFVG